MATLEVCLDLGSSKLHRGAFTDTFVETPQWMQVFSSAMFGSEDSRRLEVTQPVWPEVRFLCQSPAQDVSL
jgi:hypothetical protein